MDDNNRFLLEKLEKNEGDLEASGRNQIDTKDDAGPSNSETKHHDVESNSSFYCDGNFSTSSYSQETRAPSNLAPQLIMSAYGQSYSIPSYGPSYSIPSYGPSYSIPSYGPSYSIPSYGPIYSIPSYGPSYSSSTSDSIAGALHSSSEASEGSGTAYILVPVAESRVDFRWTENKQSNLSNSLSPQNDLEKSIWRPASLMEPKNTRVGADTSSCREMENEASIFSPERKLIDLDSISTPQMSTEQEGKEAIAQTSADYRQLRGTSATFSPIEAASNIGTSTDRLVIRSAAGLEEVSITESSRTQTLSQTSGKAKPFKCGVCGKTFISKWNLNRHSGIHTGDKRFVCNTCGKKYNDTTSLRNHLLIHSDEKPHNCRYCVKKFRLKSVLKDHLLTHTKEKPFACYTCGKGFARKHHLGRHLLTHTGEKPFKCGWCGRGFTTNQNRIEHQKRKHSRK